MKDMGVAEAVWPLVKRDECGVKTEHLPYNSLSILQNLPTPVNKHDQNTEVSSLDNERQGHEEGSRVKKVKLWHLKNTKKHT